MPSPRTPSVFPPEPGARMLTVEASPSATATMLAVDWVIVAGPVLLPTAIAATRAARRTQHDVETLFWFVPYQMFVIAVGWNTTSVSSRFTGRNDKQRRERRA